jgi:hypothetical protein
MFFEGPSIFSYGHHFEIARIVRPDVVLFTSRDYSVSTSKHKSRTHSAISHMRVFVVPSMTDHKANAEYLIKTLEDELARISRMRKDSIFTLERYAYQAERAAAYVLEFGKHVPKPLQRKIAEIFKARENPLTPEQTAKLKARAAADRAEKEKKTAARRAELQGDYDAWKAGTLAVMPWDASGLFPVALRVIDNEIQTSQGANIPVIEARKFWHVLRAGGSVDGMRLGHYTVTGIRDGALIVGCHTIPMREVARMSVTLGLESQEVA